MEMVASISCTREADRRRGCTYNLFERFALSSFSKELEKMAHGVGKGLGWSALGISRRPAIGYGSMRQ